MSEAVLTTTPVDTDKPKFFNYKGITTILGGVGFLGLVAFLSAGSGDTHKFMLNSYMYGYVFWLMVTCGCLALTLLHNSIKSSWTLPVLRIFEAGASWQTWAMLGVGLLPLLLKTDVVYEWARPEAANDFILAKKAVFLNKPVFGGVILGGYALFAFMANTLRKSTNRHDKSLDENEYQFRTNFATPMMVIFVSVLTFVLTLLAMSLTPKWYSTIYTLWLLIGGCQAALSMAIFLVARNASKQPYANVMAPGLTKDLGNMMFVLTMLWGYTSVSQLIILWNGNLPETTVFYAHRGADAMLGWNLIGASTILGCFVIPFVTLLSPRVKRYADRLAMIALFIFCFRILDVYWIIGASIPNRMSPQAFGPSTIFDATGWVVMAFAWFAVMLNNVEKAPLLPIYDKRLEEAKKNAH